MSVKWRAAKNLAEGQLEGRQKLLKNIKLFLKGRGFTFPRPALFLVSILLAGILLFESLLSSPCLHRQSRSGPHAQPSSLPGFGSWYPATGPTPPHPRPRPRLRRASSRANARPSPRPTPAPAAEMRSLQLAGPSCFRGAAAVLCVSGLLPPYTPAGSLLGIGPIKAPARPPNSYLRLRGRGRSLEAGTRARRRRSPAP